MEQHVSEPEDRPGLTAAGGWCAPSAELYDLNVFKAGRGASGLLRLPDLMPRPLTRRQRLRRWIMGQRRRARAVWQALPDIWANPYGYWSDDDD